MGVEDAKAWIDLLRDGGPYAVLFFLGLSWWSKERYIQHLHAKIVEISISNTTALHSVKTAVDSMVKLIERE